MINQGQKIQKKKQKWGFCHPDETFAIHEMKEKDIEKILKIEKQSFITPWTDKMIKETILSPLYTGFVIEENNVLLGYIMLYSVLDEVHILSLDVDPDYRGRGFASHLIHYIIEHYGKSGVSYFFLEVRDSNIRAIKLYKILGFEITGKRKGYYTDTNEDALLMELKL